jgi:apolipoprotein N-acyltransferase
LIEIVTEAEIQQDQPASTVSTPHAETAIVPFWRDPLTLPSALLWSAAAVTAFHLAYCTPSLALLTIVYVFALLQLMRARTGRQSFYLSLGVGMFIAAPQLSCFWTLFGPSSIALWLILALWTTLFVTLGRFCIIRLGVLRAALLLPFLWTGLEYFRSELYYLRFSWLNIGYAFSASAYQPALNFAGMYGIGFFAATIAAGIWLLGLKRVAIFVGVVTLSCALIWSVFWGGLDKRKLGKPVQVAGVQLEFPAEPEVVSALDKLLESKPETQIIVLCEYAFLSPIPDSVKQWCNEHQRYLIAGGKDPSSQGSGARAASGSSSSGDFYDTAFIVGTNGDIVFKQGKSVPVQFLKDGLPAREQKLWNSPWGKIGICICYDLSYTRVTDRLVRMGAQALIVPTMDVVEWGSHEHELHARVARVRAAEYGIPIFRVASSGISQLVDRSGVERANAGFPGQNEMLSGPLLIAHPGLLPIDRWLGPGAVGVSGLIILFLVARRVLPL